MEIVKQLTKLESVIDDCCKFRIAAYILIRTPLQQPLTAIAEQCKLSEQTVKSKIKALQKLGILRIKKKRGEPNTYFMSLVMLD